MLELKNISKRFGKDEVLNDVNLSVAVGETVAVFGPSGAGKTVLLRMVAGVEDPSSGQLLIGGEDMADVTPDQRGVGMAFQNFALFPHMDAYENIASPLNAKRSGLGADAVKRGVESVAKLLKIDHVLGHAPRALSNGQKQRTALARALANQPRVLLLDDPLRNVDAKLRFEMRLELPRLLARDGSTVLLVTQDYKEAMALGQRIAVLDAAQDAGASFVQVGTPEEIYYTPATVAVARLFGDPVINLFEATCENGKATMAGAAIPLPDTMIAPARVTLGVRPEALTFCDAETPGAVGFEVGANTPLNEKMVTLLVAADGTEVLVSRPSTEPAPPMGATAHVAFPADRLLLFDRATGARIAPGPGA